MTHTQQGQDSRQCLAAYATDFMSPRAMTHTHVCRDSLLCVNMCDMTHEHVCYEQGQGSRQCLAAHETEYVCAILITMCEYM